MTYYIGTQDNIPIDKNRFNNLVVALIELDKYRLLNYNKPLYICTTKGENDNDNQ